VYQSLYCYDGPLLCGFNVAIKALITTLISSFKIKTRVGR